MISRERRRELKSALAVMIDLALRSGYLDVGECLVAMGISGDAVVTPEEEGFVTAQVDGIVQRLR